MKEINLLDLIQYIDIGAEPNTELVRWVKPGASVFRMDILAARAEATNYYKKIDNPQKKMRTVFIKDSKLVFNITADESLQYQLLEAILEQIILDFHNNYGNLCCEIIAGTENMFQGYEKRIPSIIEKANTEAVKWVKCECRICKTDYLVCIKKSLVEKASNFPVSIVFYHRGHGTVIYLDANFKVRGVEIVEITG